MPKINQLNSATSLANTDIMIADTSTGSNTRKIAYSDLKTQIQNESKSVFALKGETATDEQVATAVTNWLDTNVDPVGSAVVVDKTLSIDGAAADAKAAGDEITGLKSALTDITGDAQIPLVSHKYIDLSGSSVTMSGGAPQFSGTSATYSVGYMECTPGDEFCVSGTGGSQTRLWGFVDSSGNILEKANVSASADRLLLTAPTNAAYIIVHTNVNKRSYKVNHGSLLKDYVSSLGEEIAEITQSLSEYNEPLNDYIEPFTDSTMLTDKWIIGSIDRNGNIENYTKRICTPYYLRSSYDVTIINANPATNVSGLRIISVLYNADFTLISRTINGFGKNVTIPANTYFRICVINKDDNQEVNDVYDIAKYIRVSNDIYKSILNAQSEAEKRVSVFEMNESIRLLSEYKLGGLDTNGEVIDKNSRVVFVDYLIYDKTTQLYLEYNYSAVICLYNNDKTLLSRTVYTDGFTKVITIPANTYFRVCIWNLVETAITDIEDIVTHIYIWNPYTELYTDSEAIAILESFVVIGDSLSAGYAGSSSGNYGSEVAKAANRNWPSYLSNRINRPFTNLSKGSSSAHDWRYGNSSLGVDINAADIDTYCYMIAIGANDARQNNPIGTINDIAENYENNADTFYGNYDYIIRKLKTFANNRISQATTFVFTIPPTEPNAELYNEAIRAIAIKNYSLRVNLIDISRLFYDKFLTPPFSTTWVNGHSRPLGYMMLSNMIRIAINKYIMENPNKFIWTPWLPL